MWQLAWNAAYNFQANRGFGFCGPARPERRAERRQPGPGFFDTVQYKNRTFVKYYAYDSSQQRRQRRPGHRRDRRHRPDQGARRW